MSDPTKKPDDALLVTLSVADLRRIIAQEIKAAMGEDPPLDKPLEVGYKAIIAYDKSGIESHTQALRLDAETTSGGRGDYPERPSNGRARRDRNQRTTSPSDSIDRCGGGC